MKNNRTLIITTIACLLPILFGLMVYTKLPSEVAIHFDFSGKPDDYAPKWFAVTLIPVLFAGINIFTQVVMKNDPKRKNYSEKLFVIVIWLIPLLALIIQPIILLLALGYDIEINHILSLFMGLLFIVIGNYLPKCKQNYTMGIKLPWTLNDEDNWNKTHHLAGFLFVIAGILLMTTALFNSSILFIIVIIIIGVLFIVPIIYSFMLYKKNLK